MGLNSRNIKSQRILEITCIADVSDNGFDISSVKYYRDGLGSPSQDVAFSANASPGTNPQYIELGEAIPQGTILVLTGTIRA